MEDLIYLNYLPSSISIAAYSVKALINQNLIFSYHHLYFNFIDY